MATSPTPICTIDQTGIHRPTLAAVLDWAATQFRAIYGADVSLDSSTQDGELVGLFASAIDDTNAMAVQAYNAFSPATAQGVGLSSVVKINGIQRDVPSYSTAPMLVVGQANTPVTGGRLAGPAGLIWALPASLVIPSSGQIAATATCETLGANAALVGEIHEIVNSQPGWQTATNTEPATLGSPVELDPQLRVRQSLSTMVSATAIAAALEGDILALPGVYRARVYSNEGNLTDANGIPGHCMAMVVNGGDINTIASTVMNKKGGCGTFGDTFVYLTDPYGVKARVAFFADAATPITVRITINQLVAFTSDTLDQIKSAVSDWINALGIGNSVQWNRLYAPAYLNGAAISQTYEIVSIAIARDGATPTAADVAIRFNEDASCSTALVNVIVLN